MRLLYPAVGLCVLSLALTGCSTGGSAPTETMLSMPASPSPTTEAPAPTPDAQAGDASGTGPDGGAQADAVPATASPHCVIVAGGVTTAMLAPLTLRSESDPKELVALRQQILDLRGKVPVDLQDDFEVMAESVEAPPRGSGTFDERSFRDAMVPVQDWLAQHCAHS